jgi:hypothetical protein
MYVSSIVYAKRHQVYSKAKQIIVKVHLKYIASGLQNG